ncbi:hypothetical protein FRB99_006348 [Tulasnella sp. 403]|nr:hypothetical protein FRB99_006348 [Tulasnella sp. 403]
MAPFSVAVAGGTGSLGALIVKAFLEPSVYPSTVNRVVVLTRSDSSPALKELQAKGAEISVVGDAPTAESLKGVDVLVNALTHFASPQLNEAYARAAKDAGVKVYFPTEYGSDSRQIGVKIGVLAAKDGASKLAAEIGQGVFKTIIVHTGVFLQGQFTFGESGDKVEIKTLDADKFKAEYDGADFVGGLQYALGTGGGDFSVQNDNELVNPGESLWKWTTLAEFVKEAKGSEWN